MAITYAWANADSTSIIYVDDSTTPNTEKSIPVATGNRDYKAYLASGITADEYVAPSAPAEPVQLTPAEKLAAIGLTVEDLQTLLTEPESEQPVVEEPESEETGVEEPVVEEPVVEEPAE